MKIYNTMSKKSEEFKAIKKEEVTMYCCGPTAYDFVHIGNLRTFVFYDIMKRVLTYEGFNVKQIINITDVDDRTIKKSRDANMSLRSYTEIYTKYFREDCSKLNILPASFYPKATENIADMQKLVMGLLKKEYAYESEDGIYYDIAKFKEYGKLSGIKLSGAISRIKNDEYDKESASDFALWKKWDKNDGEVYWTGELPKGRPGWSIECSAMAMKYLGETLDIHSGAIDLIFPHHENEIAQSEAYTGKTFVNYWVHPGHLLINKQKMAKSLKNFYTIRDLEKLGFDPISFRLLVLDYNYRNTLDFDIETLKKYEKTLDGIDIDISAFKAIEIQLHGNENAAPIQDALKKFEKGISDDFDTHCALEAFFDLITIMNEKTSAGKVTKSFYVLAVEALEKMNAVLGIIKEYKIPQKIIKLAEERKNLRKENEWSKADEIRRLIKDAGFKIIDLINQNYLIIKDRKYGR
jgi:cysteinyl-tRNA synthetase